MSGFRCEDWRWGDWSATIQIGTCLNSVWLFVAMLGHLSAVFIWERKVKPYEGIDLFWWVDHDGAGVPIPGCGGTPSRRGPGENLIGNS